MEGYRGLVNVPYYEFELFLTCSTLHALVYL
jgi:hypothetical protein